MADTKPGIEVFFGCLPPPPKAPVTIEQMKEAAAKGWAGEVPAHGHQKDETK